MEKSIQSGYNSWFYGVRLSACKFKIKMVKGELKSKKEHKRGIFRT